MTGDELRAWREARGMSAPILADELDVSSRTVLRWEKMDVLARRDEYAVRWLDHLLAGDLGPSDRLG